MYTDRLLVEEIGGKQSVILARWNVLSQKEAKVMKYNHCFVRVIVLCEAVIASQKRSIEEIITRATCKSPSTHLNVY